jgi:tripartite-type tricarboxylate transporter receptor subunit TctC
MIKKRILVAALLGVSLFAFMLGAPSVFAKDWPSQTINMIVGWGAGGSSDLTTRMLSEALQKSLGVPVVVENKTGAASLLSLRFVSMAKPDGYTLGFMSCTAITEKPFFTKNFPFDPINGLSYLAQVFNYGYGFVVRADSPWKTFPEFVEAAKKQPGKLTVSMSGIGTTMHVALAKLENKIPGFKVTVVPFKGGVAAVTALLGGHVDACFQTQEWKSYVDSGKLRLLAAPQKERWKEYPDVPTWIDLGYGISALSQGGYVAPPGLPEPIRKRLEDELKKGMEYPGFKKIAKQFGLIESYKPGKELYEELMIIYKENKEIIPKMGISSEK